MGRKQLCMKIQPLLFSVDFIFGVPNLVSKQQTCTYVHKTSLQWMELVHRLVLVSPLQVQQDLLDQRQTVAISYLQLLHLVNAIFLNRHQAQQTKCDM